MVRKTRQYTNPFLKANTQFLPYAPSTQQQLQKAIEFHRQSQFEQVAKLYYQILEIDPHHEDALHSAKTAVKINPQDPQARINLSLAMLENGAKGVREHIELVKRVMAFSPELSRELEASIADGLQRKPGWPALEKVKAWLAA